MTVWIFTTTIMVEAFLVVSLIVTLVNPSLRVWPPPERNSWQYFFTWGLSIGSWAGILTLGILDWNSFRARPLVAIPDRPWPDYLQCYFGHLGNTDSWFSRFPGTGRETCTTRPVLIYPKPAIFSEYRYVRRLCGFTEFGLCPGHMSAGIRPVHSSALFRFHFASIQLLKLKIASFYVHFSTPSPL